MKSPVMEALAHSGSPVHTSSDPSSVAAAQTSQHISLGSLSRWGTTFLHEDIEEDNDESLALRRASAAKRRWEVHKFGGTSVASADCYRQVAKIVQNPEVVDRSHQVAVIVSAMGKETPESVKVTDFLISALDLARDRNEEYKQKLDLLRQRHMTCAEDLFLSGRIGEGEKVLDGREELAIFKDILETDLKDLSDVLRAIYLGHTYSVENMELVTGYGEMWSALMFCLYLRTLGQESEWLDARQVLTVANQMEENRILVNYEVSRNKLQKIFGDRAKRPCGGNAKFGEAQFVVITGYIAATENGVPTTLRRDGSDYSASIFGALLQAFSVVIWTDVDGVYSADPRYVKDAELLESLSYQEVTELAYFGAKVVHPNTMAPAITNNIPIVIRNTFNVSCKGTTIRDQATPGKSVVKGFSIIDGLALVLIEGGGFIGFTGCVQRAFNALREAQVRMVMITQAAFEHTFRFCVHIDCAELAQKTIENALFRELLLGEITAVKIIRGCSIVAGVGEGLLTTAGIAARYLTALARAGVNVRVISQGSAERSVSTLVDSNDAALALRSVHYEFYGPETFVSVGVIIGHGLPKSSLMMLHARLVSLEKTSAGTCHFRIRAVSRQGMCEFSENGFSGPELESMLDNTEGNSSNENNGGEWRSSFIRHVRSSNTHHAVCVDLSCDHSMTNLYQLVMDAGIHVVTCNRRSLTSSSESLLSLKQCASSKGVRLLYNAAIGGSLPIVSTLRGVVALQDSERLRSISVALSTGINHLLSLLGKGVEPSLGALQSEMENIGLGAWGRCLGVESTHLEHVLDGSDMEEKLWIMANDAGMKVNRKDIEFSPLIWSKDSIPDLAAKIKTMTDIEHVPIFAGTIDCVNGRISACLERIPRSDPMAMASTGQGTVRITTDMDSSGKILCGRLGPEADIMGVLVDLEQLVRSLGIH